MLRFAWDQWSRQNNYFQVTGDDDYKDNDDDYDKSKTNKHSWKKAGSRDPGYFEKLGKIL